MECDNKIDRDACDGCVVWLMRCGVTGCGMVHVV